MGILDYFKAKPTDPEVKAAHDRAYRQEMLKIAEVKGRQDAVRKGNQKPFYQKLGGVAQNVVKEFGSVGGDDPFGLFPKKQRKRKRRLR